MGIVASVKLRRGNRIALVITALVVGLIAPTTAQAAGASLEGSILDPANDPVDGAIVTVWHATGGIAAETTSNFDGTWSVSGLANGDYKIRAGDFSLDHDWTYYGGSTFQSATTVSYSGTTVSGLDITVRPVSAVERLSGSDRYLTGAAISEDTFFLPTGKVYVASGLNFPDALAGGPGIFPGTPILLVDPNTVPSATRREITRLAPTEIVILGGTGAVSSAVEADLAVHAPVRRLAGADRYATAAAITLDGFPTGAGTVYLASGLDFPDALAGGAAAGALSSPILLTDPSQLPGSTRSELIRLDPSEVVVLGGTGAIGETVLDQVRNALPGAVVRRLAGADRFATAALVSADTFVVADRVYVANAFDFPDALVGAPAAIVSLGPLLLVTSTSVPAATRSEILRLRPQQVIVLGGPAVVSDAVISQLEALVGP